MPLRDSKILIGEESFYRSTPFRNHTIRSADLMVLFHVRYIRESEMKIFLRFSFPPATSHLLWKLRFTGSHNRFSTSRFSDENERERYGFYTEPFFHHFGCVNQFYWLRNTVARPKLSEIRKIGFIEVYLMPFYCNIVISYYETIFTILS